MSGTDQHPVLTLDDLDEETLTALRPLMRALWDLAVQRVAKKARAAAQPCHGRPHEAP
jgi:hypothetical protein